MNPTNAIFILLCLLGGPLCTAGSKGSSTQPNIIFLFADDWGRDAGCYADPKTPTPSDIVKTPNIDRVAREGVRFNNAVYDCPQCTSSRAAVYASGTLGEDAAVQFNDPDLEGGNAVFYKGEALLPPILWLDA